MLPLCAAAVAHGLYITYVGEEREEGERKGEGGREKEREGECS